MKGFLAEQGATYNKINGLPALDLFLKGRKYRCISVTCTLSHVICMVTSGKDEGDFLPV